MYSVERFAIDAPGVVELPRAAHALEAELIGFDGIPPLHEATDDLIAFGLEWVGAFNGGRLVGALAYTEADGRRDIDRLFVDPAHARQRIGRSLVESVLDAPLVTVSTGTGNVPAESLYGPSVSRSKSAARLPPG